MDIDRQIKALQAVKIILELPQELIDSIDYEKRIQLIKRLQNSKISSCAIAGEWTLNNFYKGEKNDTEYRNFKTTSASG